MEIVDRFSPFPIPGFLINRGGLQLVVFFLRVSVYRVLRLHTGVRSW